MASIRRSAGIQKPAATPPASPASAGKAASPKTLSLPTQKSTPLTELGDYTWLIYGEKKIGKTSLAAQFPDALFMMFEPGGKGLSIYQRNIGSWAEFKEFIKLLKDTDEFNTVIIDTVDIAYERCMTAVGKREGFDHPSDNNDFGKSWQMVAKEFSSVIFELINTGRGVMFISHAKESEFQEQSGAKYNKIIPTMSNQVRSFVSGFVDVIAYYGYYGKERLLTVRGSDSVDAGHRIDGRFVTPDGDSIFSIPMGSSPKEGFANIETAFQNNQEDVLEPQQRAALSMAKPAKTGAGRK